MCTKTPLDALAFLANVNARRLHDWVEDLNMRQIVANPYQEQLVVVVDWETWDFLVDNLETAKELLKATENLSLGNSPCECNLKADLATVQTCVPVACSYIEIAQDDIEHFVKN